jgi:hypothetical protein
MEKNTALTELETANNAYLQAEAARDKAAREAKEAGASWAEIAKQLGITKQRAHQRYSAPRDTSRDHLYTAAENEEADKALATLQALAAKQDAELQEHHDVTAKFLDGQAPAKPPMAKGMSKKGKTPALDRMTTGSNRAEWSILDSPFGWQVAVPEGAEPGTGKGPHACPSCGSTNHKGATNHRLEFNTDCTPTKYDPAYIVKFMRLTTKAS